MGELAVAGGTYSDIWVGMWLGEEKVVCLVILDLLVYRFCVAPGCAEVLEKRQSF